MPPPTEQWKKGFRSQPSHNSRRLAVPYQRFDHLVIPQDAEGVIDIGSLPRIIRQPSQVDRDFHPAVSIEIEKPVSAVHVAPLL